MIFGEQAKSYRMLVTLACLTGACDDNTAADPAGSSDTHAHEDSDGPEGSTTRDSSAPTSDSVGADGTTGGPSATDATGTADTTSTTNATSTTGATGTTGASDTSGSSSEDTNGSDSSDSSGAVPMVLDIQRVGRYAPMPLADLFEEGAAEISAFDPISSALLVTNGQTNSIDVIDLSDPTAPTFVRTLVASNPELDGPTSVAVDDGLVAAAFPNIDATAPGAVVFFDVDGTELASVTVGVLPDMVTFTPNGAAVITADEGEPEGYDPGQIDPEGSVSIIDLSGGVVMLDDGDVMRAGFSGLAAERIDEAVRVFGPGSTLAQDLEPEYVAVSPDSTTAWVTLQENNAMAIIDLVTAEVTSVVTLGVVDHSVTGLDASDRDDAINIATAPVFGMRQPDSIASFVQAGQTYLVTANEGDARDYDGLEEESRISSLVLDPTVFPDAELLQADTSIGRLQVTNIGGDLDDDGDEDVLYAFGSRSITIFDESGQVLWDSGDAIEQVVAAAFPDDFNSDNGENGTFDGRSDNKGPEPEGLTVGVAFGRTYVFVGLERVGGFIVWSLDDPTNPELVTYINPRDFSGDAELGEADDLAPEGLTFIPAADSPNGLPLLAVTNEVSGTVSIYALELVPE